MHEPTQTGQNQLVKQFHSYKMLKVNTFISKRNRNQLHHARGKCDFF